MPDAIPQRHRSSWLMLASLLVMLVAASMPYVNPLTPRINSDLIAFAGLALFGIVTRLCLPPSPQGLGLNPLGLLCGSWLFMALLQYASGWMDGYFSSFLLSLSYLGAVVWLGAWVQQWVDAGRGRELAEAFMGMVVVAGLLCALAICLQLLQLQEPLSPWLNKSPHHPRHSGFLGQPNLCGSLLSSALACLVFVGAPHAQSSAKPSAWRMAAMVLLMLGVYGTGSRSAYLEVLLLSLLLIWMRRRMAISGWWCALAVWQLLVFALADALNASGVVSSQSTLATLHGAEASQNSRLDILKDAWAIIQTSPWWGVGWRRYQLAGVLNPYVVDPADHSHNLLVQIQAELGVAGSLSLLAFGLYWLFLNRPWRHTQGQTVAMLGVATVMTAHSLLEYPLWHALHLFVFTIALNLLPATTVRWRLKPWLITATAPLFLALTLWVAADHRQAERALLRFHASHDVHQYAKDNEGVFWFKLLLDSTVVTELPLNANTHEMIKTVALENANVFSQSLFANQPLLQLMILEGRTDVANRLASRMCTHFGGQTMSAIQLNLTLAHEAPYTAWLQQLPEDIRHCKPLPESTN